MKDKIKAMLGAGITAKYAGSWYGVDGAGPSGVLQLQTDGRITRERGPYSQDYAARLRRAVREAGFTTPLAVTGFNVPSTWGELERMLPND
jgi:hypothetical protein